MWAIIVAVVIIFIIWKLANGCSRGQQGPSSKQGSSSTNKPNATFRCPNCGSPAKINGKQWECGWCGDYGYLR